MWRRQLRGRLRRKLNALGWDLHRYAPDTSLATLVPWLVDHLGVNCVFDVGARYGEYRDYLRQYGYRGRIVSFEPVRANFEVLARTGARDRDWYGFPCALGSTSGTRMINVTRSTNFSSLHAPTALGNQLYPDSAIDRMEPCTIRTLDGVFGEAIRGIANPRVYLKMDTQGWDLEVLRGAAGCLSSVVALQSEMSVLPLYEHAPTYTEALAEIGKAGFGLCAVYRVNWTPNDELVEFDAVMVRKVGLGLQALQTVSDGPRAAFRA